MKTSGIVKTMLVLAYFACAFSTGANAEQTIRIDAPKNNLSLDPRIINVQGIVTADSAVENNGIVEIRGTELVKSVVSVMADKGALAGNPGIKLAEVNAMTPRETSLEHLTKDLAKGPTSPRVDVRDMGKPDIKPPTDISPSPVPAPKRRIFEPTIKPAYAAMSCNNFSCD